MKMLPNILLVDDEPLILNSLTRLLEDDYTVHTAENGVRALMILQTIAVQVIVSDQRMPAMLGHELLAKAKVLSPHTVRILLTGYSDLEATVSSVNEAEIFRYITKPWQADKLLETLALACKVAARLAASPVPLPAVTPRSADPFDVPIQKLNLLVISSRAESMKVMKAMFVREHVLHTASTTESAFMVLRAWPVAVMIVESFNHNYHAPNTYTPSTSHSNSGEIIDEVDFLSVVRNVYPDVMPILISDNKDAAVAIRLANEGRVFRYISRPFEPESLRNAVRDAASLHDLYVQRPNLNAQRHDADISGAGAEAASKLSSPSFSLKEFFGGLINRLRSRKTY
ncbi:MAG: response regulator [Rhizobacter sp.]|nr:response regulator [Chlorobiales bacterium]